MKLNIKDTAFAHDKFSVAGQTTDKIEWVRDDSGSPLYTFYTNEQCYGPIKFNSVPGYKNIAWLIESKGIIPHIYNNFDKVADRFDVILTHSNEILKKYPDKAKWIFGGGSYIGTPHGGGEEKVYPKSKFCSIVSSTKRMCPLHDFRLQVAQMIYDTKEFVDIFGTVVGEWEPIIKSLADYKYSIIIENYIDDAFWTEKLTNCFLTGTIPIYYGARNIGEYFDLNGIIKVSSIDDISYTLLELQYLKHNDYNDRIDAVKENFERAKKYRLMEDFISENLGSWCK